MTIIDVLILVAAALAVITVAGFVTLVTMTRPPHRYEAAAFWVFAEPSVVERTAARRR